MLKKVSIKLLSFIQIINIIDFFAKLLIFSILIIDYNLFLLIFKYFII